MGNRKPITAGNWKLHKNNRETVTFVNELKLGLPSGLSCDVIIAPTFLALSDAKTSSAGSMLRLAAQNCYRKNEGAYTGEISPSHLRALGCEYVILGHSERRHIFGETDELINEKIRQSMAERLVPIFCIGETIEERRSGQVEDVLRRQVTRGLAGVNITGGHDIIIAYEPVWAIGTGEVAGEQDAQQAHVFVRSLLAGIYGKETADSLRILYGGSTKPDNIEGLMRQPDIDGALIGGASLKAESFIKMAEIIGASGSKAP